MQVSGLDQSEICDQRAHLCAVFQATDQVGVGRKVLVHHRCARVAGVLNKYVDRVTLQRLRPGRCCEDDQLAALGLRPELVDVLDDIVVDLLQVIDHVRQIVILLPNVCDQIFNGVLSDLPVYRF